MGSDYANLHHIIRAHSNYDKQVDVGSNLRLYLGLYVKDLRLGLSLDLKDLRLGL